MMQDHSQTAMRNCHAYASPLFPKACNELPCLAGLLTRPSLSPSHTDGPYSGFFIGRPYTDLQQRALLPICTAFPWPKRLQRYMIFRYGDCPADKKSLKNPKRKSIVLKDFETDFHKISCEANTTKGGSARKRNLLNCDPGE